uniref:Uncharacterized protein n=1 Tax=Trichobilharzia regenti TaxID=157069 RepID=A0AA85IMH5_TRIRE|nr:unnamed protein product [Trichobilharzia regenti]
MFETLNDFCQASKFLMTDQLEHQCSLQQYDKETMSNLSSLMNIYYAFNYYYNNNSSHYIDNSQQKSNIEPVMMTPFITTLSPYTEYPIWSSILISAAAAAAASTNKLTPTLSSCVTMPSTSGEQCDTLLSLPSLSSIILANNELPKEVDMMKGKYENEFLSKFFNCALMESENFCCNETEQLNLSSLSSLSTSSSTSSSLCSTSSVSSSSSSSSSSGSKLSDTKRSSGFFVKDLINSDHCERYSRYDDSCMNDCHHVKEGKRVSEQDPKDEEEEEVIGECDTTMKDNSKNCDDDHVSNSLKNLFNMNVKKASSTVKFTTISQDAHKMNCAKKASKEEVNRLKSNRHNSHNRKLNSRHRTNEASSSSNKLTTNDAASRLHLPAWVFCTRYSDRPSSGPRIRKPRMCRTNDEIN